jgi:hypothetical protein
LWDGKLQGANGGLEGSWFESVGAAIALDAALVRAGPNVILALDEHGGIHEDLSDVCEAFTEAFGEKDLEDLVLEGIVGLFVHGLSHFGVVTSD